MHAARGEIIAYTDSDCVVDPHWLTLMMRSMVENNFDGCGGPNYAPHEDGWIEASCAASPGAPCHVLVAEDRAEHLAGCNMVFSKAALAKIGGFDAQFRTAGDDVDICWRMLDAGFKLGILAGGLRLALPPQHGEGLLRTAARLRTGRGDALSEISRALQRDGPNRVARHDSRSRAHDSGRQAANACCGRRQPQVRRRCSIPA